MVGPVGNHCALIVATLFNLGLVLLTGFLVYSEVPDDRMVAVQAVLSLIMIFLMWYVACKDPGIIDIATFDSDQVRPLTRTDHNIDDAETHYQEAHIYQARYCETCKITRPPLSSHCKYCNVCVINFDHHCSVVNQCIGRRNHRAFVLCLLFAWLSYLWMACFTLFDIVVYDMIKLGFDKLGSDATRNEGIWEIVLDSVVIALVSVKMVCAACCGRVVSFG